MVSRPQALFAIVALAIGCTPTTVTYPGPRRPMPDIAVLVNSETALNMFDGLKLTHFTSQDGARYEILPGRHTLGVTLFIVSVMPGYGADIERSPNTAVFCLDAQAGHTYVIGHERRGAQWQPVITDDDTNAVVPFAPCSKT